MYHPVVQQIKDLLIKHDCWFETFEHEPVRTSEEAAAIRHGYTLHQGAKAIIIRAKIMGGGKKFVMFVVPGDMRFANDKVKQMLHAKDIRLATEEELSVITNGVKIGGIPPFGTLFGLEVFADLDLLNNEKIIFNAGDRSYSIAMLSTDYMRIVKPIAANIT